MNWKDVYSSKSRFWRTIGSWYAMGCLFLLGTVSEIHSYRVSGKIVIRSVVLTGSDAISYIVALAIVTVGAISYATFIAIYGIRYFKSPHPANELTPENWICIKCKDTFPGYSIKGKACPHCGGTLEDLEGFFARHPEVK